MSQQTAQFLWVGPGLSPLESACLRSFVEVGYAVHLYTYDELTSVPDHVIMKDASEILPKADIFLGAGSKGGSYAPFADRFRYHLLHKRGGWWFDTDHFAVRLLTEPDDLKVASQWEGPAGEYATVSAIWCTPGDPHVGWLAERCDTILKSGKPLQYTQLGPILMNEMIDIFGLRANVAPWWEFCPYHHYMIDRLVYRTNREFARDRAKLAYHLIKQVLRKDFEAAYIRPGTRAIHLWNEIWKAHGISKTELYHPGSLYGKLQRRYAAPPRPG